MAVSSGKGFVSEINVTPFVDVMLVLLIIFMVTAPMMTEGLEVDLPQTRAVSTLPTETESLVLTVRYDNSLYLDTYRLDLDELEDKVKLLVTDQKKQLFLQADKNVSYGLVVTIMGKLKSAGVEKLGVIAMPESGADTAGKNADPG
jgi:biopolymer transport protein TolR